jgi:hypothetical protein
MEKTLTRAEKRRQKREEKNAKVRYVPTKADKQIEYLKRKKLTK